MRSLILAFFLIPTYCFAQVEWAPVGAKWWYEQTYVSPVGSSYDIGYYNMEVIGDTIVLGRTCRELSWEENGQYCYTCDHRPYYVYSDSGRVYYFNHDDEAFTLLYDMNKGIGESWEVNFFNEYMNDDVTLTMTVIDTMSIWVNGVRLRQQKVDYHSQFSFGDVITEGLGSTEAFFPNCQNGGGCETIYGALRCYEDSILGMYHITIDSCEWKYTYVSLEELEQAEMRLWPNPANYLMNIETDGRQGFVVALHDMAGREVFASPMLSSKQSINTVDIPAGVYVAVLREKGAVVARRKVIVE